MKADTRLIEGVGRGMSASQRFLFLLCLSALQLGGCTILSIDEDQARRRAGQGAVDPNAFVAREWARRALPAITSRAMPIGDLVPAITRDLAAAGARSGRQAGEGAAWTFAVRGDGVVEAIDRTSRRAVATIAASTPNGPVRAILQVGPVVSGTAVRDALDFVSFNDFADQLAFAAVGNALTAQALRASQPALDTLQPGDRLRFLAVANVRDAKAPLILTPVQVAKLP